MSSVGSAWEGVVKIEGEEISEIEENGRGSICSRNDGSRPFCTQSYDVTSVSGNHARR